MPQAELCRIWQVGSGQLALREARANSGVYFDHRPTLRKSTGMWSIRVFSSSPATDILSEVRPASFGVRNTPWDTTPARPGTSPAARLIDRVSEPMQWATTDSGRSPMR